MPNIFSRPFRLHCPNTILLRQALSQLLLNVTTIDADALVGMYPGLLYARCRFRFLGEQMGRVLRRLSQTSTMELLGLVVNTGLLQRAKKVGRFLAKQDGNIPRFSEQHRNLLVNLLTHPESPKKSLFIGFCSLAVLCDRRPDQLSADEQNHIDRIKVMMRHSFFRADMAPFLIWLYNLNFGMTSPVFCPTNAEFDDMFVLFVSKYSWINVAIREILNAPPPHPPAPPVVQNQIL
jgi:hypothetical protein